MDLKGLCRIIRIIRPSADTYCPISICGDLIKKANGISVGLIFFKLRLTACRNRNPVLFIITEKDIGCGFALRKLSRQAVGEFAGYSTGSICRINTDPCAAAQGSSIVYFDFFISYFAWMRCIR